MSNPPLAELIRPKIIKDFIGQSHLLGNNKPIKLAINKNQVHSMIFWGPPGCGKTTLALLLANHTKANFSKLSAVSAGKADVKKIIQEAKSSSNRTIIFLDEIHRFNKAQQDFLLPFVENGTITLIGATTENPSFSVISPLLSRTQVFTFNPHSDQEISQIISLGQKALKIKTISKSALEYLINFSDGDARQALNLLENTFSLYGSITLKNLKNTLQSKFLNYDKKGENHYNIISAFIKSMRASSVDASLYYLARMVNSGEDPLFIARRMVVFASEDVASPTALVVANAVFQACQQIGYPECQENLAAGTVYLAQAKKDRSSYDAYMKALGDVKKFGNLPIPLNLRNAPTKLMKDLDYGKDYKMYTKYSLLPDKLKDKKYYFKPNP